jgi:acetylornithine deacetylase/succinyl-diaminopimelate desuccinylase-like protein
VRFDPSQPALQAARRAFERALGRPAALVRTGGSIPVLSAFAERGIPTILSGFSLSDDNLHAPNERFAIASLDHGRRAARALYEELGAALG